MINGVGMFNPLMMSYTRLPIAMAEDGVCCRSSLLTGSTSERGTVGQRTLLRHNLGAGLGSQL